MWFRFCVAVALGVALVATPATADDDTDRAIAAIKSVKKEGKGNDDAGPAWKTLVSKGGAALMPTLEAFEESNPTAANWLRTAVDAIAEGEKSAGRALPAGKLEAFATNAKLAPAARRIAYELLVSQDTAAKERLLPGFLNDKSADMRRDAIEAQLEKLERAAPPTIKTDLEKLFSYTRDRDQVDLLAKKIAAKGGKVGVTEHFGFLTHVSIVGPFDAPESKGYETAYPVDTAKDTAGKFKGKAGADVVWKPVSTTDKYGSFDLTKLLDKHKNSVAYALAVIVAENETPCDIRATSPTSVKIFLNGKELFGHDEYHHGEPLDAHKAKGTLKKGENVVLLKVCQNDQKEPWAQAWHFQIRLCDDTGGPLKHVTQLITENGTAKRIPLGHNPNPTEPMEEKK